PAVELPSEERGEEEAGDEGEQDRHAEADHGAAPAEQPDPLGARRLRVLPAEADDAPLERLADRDPDVVVEKSDDEVHHRRRQDDGQDREQALEKEALHGSTAILRDDERILKRQSGIPARGPAAAQPLMQPSGRRRATLSVTPACCMTSTTSDASL